MELDIMTAAAAGLSAHSDPAQEFPCGILHCTYEEFPKVLHANRQMFRFLGISERSEEWRGFIQNNIFFMIPTEERTIFRKYLAVADKTDEPVAIEHGVCSGTGGQTRLVGWVRAVPNREGEREYHFLYMELPQPILSLHQTRERAYEQALRGVYDLIIKFDSANRTLECVHKSDVEQLPYILGTKLVINSVIKDEFFSHVDIADRERVEVFLRMAARPAQSNPGVPTSIRFRYNMSGEPIEYLCVATSLDESVTLLCGRNNNRGVQIPVSSGIVPRPLLPQNSPADDAERQPRVFIRTFGYFDVFVDGEPVVFRYEKSKEMLAILVDRKGSFVANPYLISCLWEDEPYNEKIQSRCRQTAYRLMETLKQYGIEDIIEKVAGRRRIIPEKVDCDCYNYMEGKQVSGQAFNGSYMSDYSWGETTLSTLTQSKNTLP